MLGHGLDHRDALAQGVREGFFAEDVLASFGGGDGRDGVPVVGGRDADGVDVLACDQLAEVLVGLAVLVAVAGVDLLEGVLQVLVIDIANGHHAAVVLTQEAVEV